MKITAAFASLTAATGSVVAAGITHSATLLIIALVLIGILLAIEVSLVVLYVRRPGDRQDLLKLYRVWRGR